MKVWEYFHIKQHKNVYSENLQILISTYEYRIEFVVGKDTVNYENTVHCDTKLTIECSGSCNPSLCATVYNVSNGHGVEEF